MKRRENVNDSEKERGLRIWEHLWGFGEKKKGSENELNAKTKASVSGEEKKKKKKRRLYRPGLKKLHNLGSSEMRMATGNPQLKEQRGNSLI